MFLVAYISYFFLIKFAQVELISEFWTSNERYYLASYATTQVIVTFILYTGFGKLFEHIIYRWLRKNEKDLVVELNKQDEKDVKRFVNVIVRLLRFLDFFEYQDLDDLDGVTLDKEEFHQKWKRTVELIKSLAGVFILALANLLVFQGCKSSN